MIVKRDGYYFETTKRFFKDHGTVHIGLDIHSTPMDVAMGYDIYFIKDDDDYPDTILSSEESIELADFMINKWQEFKKQYQ
jgi:hypothetical protein